MIKKRLIFISVTLAVLILVLLADYFDGGYFYNATPGTNSFEKKYVRTQSEIDEYFDGMTVTDVETDLLSYEGNSIAYADADNTFYITVDISGDSPDISPISSDHKMLWLNNDGYDDMAEAIADGTVFTVYVKVDGDSYFSANVVFTGMPVMTMETLDDNETCVFEDDDGWRSTISIWNQYSDDSFYISDTASVKYRGATSLAYDKKGMRFEFDDASYSLLGMESDDDWNMNALYDDYGLIHNELSYEVWNEIASTNESDYDTGIYQEYIEVIVDGEYMGVYGLQDRYDKKKLNLQDGDILYKTISGSTPTTVEEVMEWSTLIKWPDDYTVADYVTICDWFTTFSSRENDYEDAKSILDLEESIDFALFTNLSCGRDNRLKNVYHVARLQEDGSYKLQSLPWDENVTWGEAISDTSVFFTEENYTYEELAWDIRTLANMNSEEVSEMLYDRWQELRESVITLDNLESIADADFEYLHSSGAYDRNYTKWPDSYGDWSDDLIYSFMENRLEYLDNYYESFYNDNH